MSIHINRFIDSVKAHESRGLKDFQMSIRDAKDLHADITKLLLIVENLRSQQVQKQEVIEVQIDGGGFKTT